MTLPKKSTALARWQSISAPQCAHIGTLLLPQHCIAFIKSKSPSQGKSMAQEHQREAQRAAGIREPKTHVVYVLRLGADENGVSKYYVGSSCNFMNRLHNHIMGNESSSAWVRRWQYEELIETRHV